MSNNIHKSYLESYVSFQSSESRCGKAKNGQKLLKNSYTQILKYL